MNIFEKGLKTYLSDRQIKKIRATRIGIGGAGGLGSNIALLLTRTGFSQFEIIDKDTISPSNLNRQQYYINEIGKLKVEILKKRMLQINPDLICQISAVEWEIPQAHRFFKTSDIVIEAFDNASYKAQFVEYYLSKRKVVVSGNGLAGLGGKKQLIIKKLRDLYIVGDQQTEVDRHHPPLAPRVNECASIMAGVVLNLVIPK